MVSSFSPTWEKLVFSHPRDRWKTQSLGLKLNPEKTRALQCRLYLHNLSLYIQTSKIDSVTQNDSSPQLRHLEKAKTRENILRRLSSSKIGAGFHATQVFYIHAIWSLVDCSSFSILSISPAMPQSSLKGFRNVMPLQPYDRTYIMKRL